MGEKMPAEFSTEVAQNAGHVVLVQWHGAQGATGTAGAQTRALQW